MIKFTIIFTIAIIFITFYSTCISLDNKEKDYCSNCSIMIDQYQESYIVLFDDNRFIAELSYIDEEGGNYEGRFTWKADTLILLSDKIDVTVYDPLLIQSAEFIKFIFVNKNDKLVLVDIFRFNSDQWKKEILITHETAIKENWYPMDSYFTKTPIQNILNNKKLDWMYHYIEKSSDKNIANSYWVNNANKYCFEISDLLSVKYFDLNTHKINYGYLDYYSYWHNKKEVMYKNSDTLKILYDHINYNTDSYFDKIESVELKLVEWVSVVRYDKLVWLRNNYIDLYLGNELYYNDLKSKIRDADVNYVWKSDILIRGMEFQKVNKAEYEEFIKLNTKR